MRHTEARPALSLALSAHVSNRRRKDMGVSQHRFGPRRGHIATRWKWRIFVAFRSDTPSLTMPSYTAAMYDGRQERPGCDSRVHETFFNTWTICFRLLSRFLIASAPSPIYTSPAERSRSIPLRRSSRPALLRISNTLLRYRERKDWFMSSSASSCGGVEFVPGNVGESLGSPSSTARWLATIGGHWALRSRGCLTTRVFVNQLYLDQLYWTIRTPSGPQMKTSEAVAIRNAVKFAISRGSTASFILKKPVETTMGSTTCKESAYTSTLVEQ